jgi:hypothetical protein
MKNKKLQATKICSAVGDLRDDIVERANQGRSDCSAKTRKPMLRVLRFFVPIAAAACLMIAVVFYGIPMLNDGIPLFVPPETSVNSGDISQPAQTPTNAQNPPTSAETPATTIGRGGTPSDALIILFEIAEPFVNQAQTVDEVIHFMKNIDWITNVSVFTENGVQVFEGDMHDLMIVKLEYDDGDSYVEFIRLPSVVEE